LVNDTKELPVLEPTPVETEEGEEEVKDAEPKVSEFKTKGQVNMHWFIQYILLKRISNQNMAFVNIYVDLISQMGDKSQTVAMTVHQAIGIFKRFMLIDEEQYSKVANRVPGSMPGTSLLKPYLQALGNFIGSLTLAKNRPLMAKEMDLKHLLLVGFHDN
jgi:hypothetical protein